MNVARKEVNVEELSQTDLFQKISDICTNVNAFTNARDLLESSLSNYVGKWGATLKIGF